MPTWGKTIRERDPLLEDASVEELLGELAKRLPRCDRDIEYYRDRLDKALKRRDDLTQKLAALGITNGGAA